MSENEKKTGAMVADADQHRGVEIDINDRVAQGSYSNLAIISHSPTEFVLDFASMLPGMSKPKVNNRVILSPESAKKLFMSLQDNISKYEGRYGVIASAPASAQAQDLYSIINSSSKIGEA